MLGNTEGTGFYRVAYERDLREALVARAQTDLSPIERYGLVDDAWAAVLADRMTAVDFLDMALQFGDETDLSVWQRLIGGLQLVDRLVDGEAREALRAEVRDAGGAEPRPASGARPRPAKPTAPASCGACWSRRGGVLGDDPELQGFAREVVGRRRRTASATDPSLLAAAIIGRRLDRRRGRLRAVPRPVRRRRHPAGRAALPLRAGRLRRARAGRPARAAHA